MDKQTGRKTWTDRQNESQTDRQAVNQGGKLTGRLTSGQARKYNEAPYWLKSHFKKNTSELRQSRDQSARAER